MSAVKKNISDYNLKTNIHEDDFVDIQSQHKISLLKQDQISTQIRAENPFVLTLLQAPPHLPQRKVITDRKAYHCIPPHVWSVHLIYAPNTASLHQWLRYLEQEPYLIVIRGCPTHANLPVLTHIYDLKVAVQNRRSTWSDASSLYQKLSQCKKRLKDTKAQQLEAAQHESSLDSLPEESLDLDVYTEGLNNQIQVCLEQLEILGWVPRRKTHFKEVSRQWIWLDLDEGLKLPKQFENVEKCIINPAYSEC